MSTARALPPELEPQEVELRWNNAWPSHVEVLCKGYQPALARMASLEIGDGEDLEAASRDRGIRLVTSTIAGVKEPINLLFERTSMALGERRKESTARQQAEALLSALEAASSEEAMKLSSSEWGRHIEDAFREELPKMPVGAASPAINHIRAMLSQLGMLPKWGRREKEEREQEPSTENPTQTSAKDEGNPGSCSPQTTTPRLCGDGLEKPVKARREKRNVIPKPPPGSRREEIERMISATRGTQGGRPRLRGSKLKASQVLLEVLRKGSVQQAAEHLGISKEQVEACLGWAALAAEGELPENLLPPAS